MADSNGVTRVIRADELMLSERVRLVWGFFWRGIVYVLASAVCGGLAGGIVGAVIGLIAASSGTPIADIQLGVSIVGGTLGAAISLFLYWFYIRWLLRARFGSLMLQLVRNDGPQTNVAM
jgi:ABC-type amino acid transport system permease subunit